MRFLNLARTVTQILLVTKVCGEELELVGRDQGRSGGSGGVGGSGSNGNTRAARFASTDSDSADRLVERVQAIQKIKRHEAQLQNEQQQHHHHHQLQQQQQQRNEGEIVSSPTSNSRTRTLQSSGKGSSGKGSSSKGSSSKGRSKCSGKGKGGSKGSKGVDDCTDRCTEMSVYFDHKEFIGSYKGNGVTGANGGVALYNDKGVKIGVYIETTTAVGQRSCGSQGVYSFDLKDGIPQSQIFVTKSCGCAESQAISGGTGQYQCATGSVTIMDKRGNGQEWREIRVCSGC